MVNNQTQFAVLDALDNAGAREVEAAIPAGRVEENLLRQGYSLERIQASVDAVVFSELVSWAPNGSDLFLTSAGVEVLKNN